MEVCLLLGLKRSVCNLDLSHSSEFLTIMTFFLKVWIVRYERKKVSEKDILSLFLILYFFTIAHHFLQMHLGKYKSCSQRRKNMQELEEPHVM